MPMYRYIVRTSSVPEAAGLKSGTAFTILKAMIKGIIIKKPSIKLNTTEKTISFF